MATTTPTAYATLSISETSLDEEGERQRIRLRRDLDIGAFGIGAHRTPEAGAAVIPEHDKTGPGSVREEEVYIVLNGHAVFTVAGEEIDAPQGTAVFVRDPEAKRSAVSKEPGTTVLGVAGLRGEAWRPTPGELMQPFFEPYEEKDYEAALAVAEGVVEAYPGNPLGLFNIACAESLLGRSEDAIEHLAAALAAHPAYVEQAQKDEDFEPIRDDPRYQKLIA